MSSLFGFLLIVAYGVGAWRFWNGFNRTNFSQERRLYLTLLWPAFLFNKSYRQNFMKALKG